VGDEVTLWVKDLRGGAADEDLMVKWGLGRSPRS
jgi:hypothetical protein